jgi:hypothetical protein
MDRPLIGGSWPAPKSGEQILATLLEAYKRTALVQFEPAFGNCEIKPGFVFGWRHLCSNNIGPLICSMKIRPSRTCSMVLSISTDFRAPASGSA